ncbi:MAG: DUF1292 domain-containing protein [Clostridiales bacterium]|jgi:nitrogen regulatory protein PII-like uncharacterized protein|nr:DUF1292 domain-containing protein [Clostridiales bacterium]
MSEYGNDFVVLSDEDGVESEFEHMDTLEYEGVTYMAFIPAEMSLQEEAELVILKLDGEGTDEEVLVSVDDEELLQKLFDLFVERIDEDEFYEDTEDTEDDGDDDSSQDH